MRVSYRNKAMVAVAFWFVLFVASVALFIGLRFDQNWAAPFRRGSHGGLVAAGLFLQFLCFVYGSYHLARAKGYTAALALAGLLGPPGQFAVMTALLLLPDKHSRRPARARTRRHRRFYPSPTGHIVRYRRNALLGVTLGLAGITFGVSLVLFPVRLSPDPSNVKAVGIVVFLCGYSSVITGCWWWLKAKAWVDAIVFIGLMPLAILCMPFVRLILVAVPALLPAGMVMMPLILIVIVLVLPDRSGIPKRKPWWDH